jgi:hypothetical protein
MVIKGRERTLTCRVCGVEFKTNHATQKDCDEHRARWGMKQRYKAPVSENGEIPSGISPRN